METLAESSLSHEQQPEDRCTTTEILDELESLMELFARAGLAGRPRKRLAPLLRYLVDAEFEGTVVNEYAIGVDVLERPKDWDPRFDAYVRIPRDADQRSELMSISFTAVVRNGDRHEIGTKRRAAVALQGFH